MSELILLPDQVERDQRKLLESAGFVLEQEDEQYTWYALSSS